MMPPSKDDKRERTVLALELACRYRSSDGTNTPVLCQGDVGFLSLLVNLSVGHHGDLAEPVESNRI
jgi:hypothetical protein